MDHRVPNVIVVDDEVNILKTVGICFDAIGFQTTLFSKPLEALEALRVHAFDLAFIDLKMTPIDGMQLLAEIRALSPGTTVVMITAHGSVDSAIEAIKKGAYHYLQKPFDFAELQLFAQKAWEHHQLVREVDELRQRLNTGADDGIITRSNAMREQLDLAARVADSTMSVMVEGESGTGKELIAGLIHRRSARANGPFVKVNCAALPETLLESELFGHVKGAFTGAAKDRSGRFEAADGGTIFLDEIAEISSTIQVKLLRVLQSKEFEPLGTNETRRVDVRIVAATNRDLDAALKEGSLREDLFYRLNAVRIKLSPLRERPEDIPLLLQHFLLRFSKGAPPVISDEAMRALRLYRWPGNVRELEHVVERAILLAGETVEVAHLPEEIRGIDSPVSSMSLEEIEKVHIKRVLLSARDYDEAAGILGIDPVTLWRKRKKYGL
jgi:NtrC-family two-component system response regulator AlgB